VTIETVLNLDKYSELAARTVRLREVGLGLTGDVMKAAYDYVVQHKIKNKFSHDKKPPGKILCFSFVNRHVLRLS
jgi:hypothetical protein